MREKVLGIYIRQFPLNGIKNGIHLIRLLISTLGHINARIGNVKKDMFGSFQSQPAPTTTRDVPAVLKELHLKNKIF
jgi:hypothetical protein